MYLSTVHDRPAEAQALEVLSAVIERGVTLIDTSDAYCLDDTEMGHNEQLIARALRTAGRARASMLVATKGGHTRSGGRWGLDGRPEHLRQACEASLRRLGVEVIDLYQYHRPDPNVPFEESIGALAELRREGKVRMVGLSNVSVSQIEVAAKLVPVVSVQNGLNCWQRQDEHNGVLQTCVQRGITYLAYSPFGGGVRAKYLSEITAVAAVAKRHEATPYQVVLAWLLAKAPVVIPIPCSTRVDQLRENLRAASLHLSDEDYAEIDASAPPTS
jgi:aryl-alcohol dehydrogenase-like predicted oxidoreductase